jgi:hypothetical protein
MFMKNPGKPWNNVLEQYTLENTLNFFVIPEKHK